MASVSPDGISSAGDTATPGGASSHCISSGSSNPGSRTTFTGIVSSDPRISGCFGDSTATANPAGSLTAAMNRSTRMLRQG